MKGFMTKPQERVLFQSRPDCYLPTTRTKTYGFGGPFIGAESDGRIGTDKRGTGSLLVTNQRIVVVCGSDVREWPVDSVVSCFPKTKVIASEMFLSIANHGIAKFLWYDRKSANLAADAVKMAVTGEG